MYNHSEIVANTAALHPNERKEGELIMDGPFTRHLSTVAVTVLVLAAIALVYVVLQRP